MFKRENITTFWLNLKIDFPTSTQKAVEILLSFATSYLYKSFLYETEGAPTYKVCIKFGNQ